MKYIDERNKKIYDLLDKAKSHLPDFCSRFFLGTAQTTAPLTRLNYAYDLKVFFEFLAAETETFYQKAIKSFTAQDLNKITVFDIELFADILSQSNKERGKMRKLACLRSFFAYYFKIGEIKSNILPNVDLPKIHEKPILRLEGDEIPKIINAASSGENLTKGQRRFHGRNGVRDSTIIAMFLSTGIRVSELVGLNNGDIDLEHASFKITRKGGNETVLYMSDELVEILSQYMFEYDDTLSDSPLFMTIQGSRIGVRAVQNLVKKYAAIVSPLKNISPHKLRSTFGTNLYRATGDIYVVADVLGHKDVNTTKKHYAALSDDIRKEAVQKVRLYKDKDAAQPVAAR